MQTDGSVSVDLEESLVRDGLGLTDLYGLVPRAVALAAHTVRQHRELGAAVAHVPIANNVHHGEVRSKLDRRPMERAARTLAETATAIVPIDVAQAVAYGAPPLQQ